MPNHSRTINTMYRGYFSWKKESQNRPSPQPTSMPAVPASQSSSSLASSLSSYAASSVLPAAAPSNSSQSDIASCDHAAASSASSISPKSRLFPISIAPAARSSSLAHMGQSASSTAPSSPFIPTRPIELSVSSPPSATPSRFKGFWSGRRKKSADASAEVLDCNDNDRRRALGGSEYSSAFTTPSSSVNDLQVRP